MAFYSSIYHDSYIGESYQTPYIGNYDFVPSEVLMADSSHEFRNQNFFEYNPTPYYDAYDPATDHSIIAYSISAFSEPKSVMYDLYSGDFNPALNLFRISYSISNSDFNDTEFEEYDPTPYGGGYDLAVTYGKPLAPSDELCYPRSMPDSSAVSLNGVTLGSTKPPYGKEDVDQSAAKPHMESKPAPTNEYERNKEQDNTQGYSAEKPLELYQVEVTHDDNRDDNLPWPDRGGESNEGNSYEYDMRGTQIPSGYGLEAMDLCESIFGYWPCLDRLNRRGHDCREFGNDESSREQWKKTADYLFGSSNPYEERRDGESCYGDPIYNYERHYQEQPLYRQVEYDEDSLMHKFKIF